MLVILFFAHNFSTKVHVRYYWSRRGRTVSNSSYTAVEAFTILSHSLNLIKYLIVLTGQYELIMIQDTVSHHTFILCAF